MRATQWNRLMEVLFLSYRLPGYKVSLMREGCCNAEHNTIRTPEDVFAIKSPEYDNDLLETAQMPA